LSSAKLEVDGKNSTESLVEVTYEKFDEFRKDYELLLAVVDDTMGRMSRMMMK